MYSNAIISQIRAPRSKIINTSASNDIKQAETVVINRGRIKILKPETKSIKGLKGKKKTKAINNNRIKVSHYKELNKEINSFAKRAARTRNVILKIANFTTRGVFKAKLVSPIAKNVKRLNKNKRGR